MNQPWSRNWPRCEFEHHEYVIVSARQVTHRPGPGLAPASVACRAWPPPQRALEARDERSALNLQRQCPSSRLLSSTSGRSPSHTGATALQVFSQRYERSMLVTITCPSTVERSSGSCRLTHHVILERPTAWQPAKRGHRQRRIRCRLGPADPSGHGVKAVVPPPHRPGRGRTTLVQFYSAPVACFLCPWTNGQAGRRR